ncbi:MAG: aspartate/glutamate racemase family protein [Alphaproteobacteria bacterium]
MRLLLINGNTSSFVTERVAAEARLAASPGTEIMAVTGETGARIIGTRFENAVAAREMVTLAARHAKGADGVLIAVSFDTALSALRELMPVPVVGMTEAALATGYLTGGRIGVVTLGRRVQPVYRELVEGYRLDGRVAGWRTIDDERAYTPETSAELDAKLTEACEDLIERDMAEVILLLGAVLAGAPRRLQAALPVPLIDGITSGVGQLELLVRMKLSKPAVGSLAHPGPRELTGMDPALDDLLGRSSET